MKESENFLGGEWHVVCIKCRCRRKSFCNPYDTFHSWCIYLHFPYKSSICVAKKYTVHSMDPCGIQAIKPLYLEGALWSPKGWWKVREWIPPKCPELLNMRGSNYQAHSSRRDQFNIPRSLEVTELITIPTKKKVTKAELPFAFEFFENLGWFVKWHVSESQVVEKKSSGEEILHQLRGGYQPNSRGLYGCFLKWWYPQIIHF